MSTPSNPNPAISKGHVIGLGVVTANSSLFSIAGSSLIIFMILRRKGLFSLRNRLIFMMSITDIFFSLSLGLTVIPSPPIDNYGDPTHYGFGNDATCTLQGFFSQFLISTPSYNSMLCLYYLAVIRYRIEDNTIAKLEPLMHIYSLVFPLALAIGASSTDLYQSTGRMCWIIAPFFNTFRLLTNLYTVLNGLVITVSMIITYRTVRAQERAVQQYSFPNSNQNAAADEAFDGETSPNLSRREKRRRRRFSTTSVAMGAPPTPEVSTGAGGNSSSPALRKTFHQAMLYVAGFFVTYIWAFIIIIFRTSSALDPALLPLRYGQAVFFPLQGFCNFLAFIHPKFISKRRENPQLKFFAVLKAIITDNTPMRPAATNRQMAPRRRRGSTARLSNPEDGPNQNTTDHSNLPMRQIALPPMRNVSIIQDSGEGDVPRRRMSSFDDLTTADSMLDKNNNNSNHPQEDKHPSDFNGRKRRRHSLTSITESDVIVSDQKKFLPISPGEFMLTHDSEKDHDNNISDLESDIDETSVKIEETEKVESIETKGSPEKVADDVSEKVDEGSLEKADEKDSEKFEEKSPENTEE